ncbi:MAG: hypothetical protein JNK14_19775 [Chitinophagaceae bacterium]|nr:hypothetical protein [Chitinophagaceae bacterium]
MKRPPVIIILFCLYMTLPVMTTAQYYYHNEKYYENDLVIELGASAGIINAMTDLGGRKGTGKGFIKDLNLKTSKPSFGFYILGMYKEAIGVRLEGSFGQVRAYDSILKNVAPSTFGRYERNLSFRSSIRDFQLAVEVHPLFFRHYGENEAPYWSPYAIAGIGYFSFNPEAELNGRWHALQPLRTEGQGFAEYPDRKPYKLSQINIPVGIGVRYEINSFLNARLEVVHRFLMTDYLDDVSETDFADPSLFYNYLSPAQAAVAEQLSNRSLPGSKVFQRGDPKDNDSFFTIQLKIGATIQSSRR